MNSPYDDIIVDGGSAGSALGHRLSADPANKVLVLEGLRVVDVSVFPYVTNGNIYSPVMMVAEKAADLVLGKEPLPADHIDFYCGSR